VLRGEDLGGFAIGWLMVVLLVLANYTVIPLFIK